MRVGAERATVKGGDGHAVAGDELRVGRQSGELNLECFDGSAYLATPAHDAAHVLALRLGECGRCATTVAAHSVARPLHECSNHARAVLSHVAANHLRVESG